MSDYKFANKMTGEIRLSNIGYRVSGISVLPINMSSDYPRRKNEDKTIYQSIFNVAHLTDWGSLHFTKPEKRGEIDDFNEIILPLQNEIRRELGLQEEGKETVVFYPRNDQF